MVVRISNRELNELTSTPTEYKRKRVTAAHTPEKRHKCLPEGGDAFSEVSSTSATLQNSPARHTAKRKFDDRNGTLGERPVDAKVKKINLNSPEQDLRVSAWIEELSCNTNTANTFEPIPQDDTRSVACLKSSGSTSLSSSTYNSNPGRSNLLYTQCQLQRLSPDLKNPTRTAVLLGTPKAIINQPKYQNMCWM